MKWFDIDRFNEISDTLTRNKARSFLTGFGVFWGIFMLVFLAGGSSGLKEALANQMENFATNAAFVMPDNTGKPYKGFEKGRSWELTFRDAKRVKALVPECDVVTPLILSGAANDNTVMRGDNKTNCSMRGIYPEYGKIEPPTISHGRFINDMDVEQNRKVCVVSEMVYKNLFPGGGNPCGEKIQVGNSFFEIIGVDLNPHEMVNFGPYGAYTIVIPITTFRDLYGTGDKADILGMTMKPGAHVADITPRVRGAIAREHDIDPTDEEGIMILNTEVMFSMLESLFKGVNILAWLIGLGTLLAGIIGVSNIMMVTVRERTSEIGIRRAIGATPKMILSQIMSESVVLTILAGMLGILFAVLVLGGLELATTENGVSVASFQVSFWAAFEALAGLVVLGAVSGLAPAIRAMEIKPVDAMRDE